MGPSSSDSQAMPSARVSRAELADAVEQLLRIVEQLWDEVIELRRDLKETIVIVNPKD